MLQSLQHHNEEVLKFFSVCLQTILRMTIKVPLLFQEATWYFLLGRDHDLNVSEIEVIIESICMSQDDGSFFSNNLRLMVIEAVAILSRAYIFEGKWEQKVQ